MRQTKDQKSQQDRWEVDGLQIAQRVVRIEQRLNAVVLRVPLGAKLSRDEDGIEWTEDKEQSQLKSYEPCCLQDFLILSQSTPAKVLKFAQEWGPLVLVKGVQLESALFWEVDKPVTEVKKRKEVKKHEQPPQPLSAWSYFASQMEAVLELTSYLRTPGVRSEQGAKAAWSTLTYDTAFPRLDPGKTTEEAIDERNEYIQHLISILVTGWLGDIEAAPLVAWEDQAFCLRLWTPQKRYASLQAALVLHLVSVISNPHQLFRCGWCGRIGLKIGEQRKTRTGLVPTCGSEECKNASSRHRQQRCRAKKRGATLQPAQS